MITRSLIFLFFLGLITGLSSFISLAQAQNSDQNSNGILQKWAPLLFGEDDKLGPQDTLVAPFANEQDRKAQENTRTVPNLSNTDSPLNQPHISHKEIQNWLISLVSISMNFENQNFESNINKIRPYFTEQALQDYVNILGAEDIFDAVRNRNQKLSSIIIERPVLTYWDDSCPKLVSEFTQSGRYHWRFDFELIYSLVENTQAATAQDAPVPTGTKVLLRALMARAPASDNRYGLKIINWGYATRC